MTLYTAKRLFCLTTSLAVLTWPGVVSAETLREALMKAYNTNPTLNSARAAQRANDENVPIARANGLPNIGVQTNYTEQVVRPGNSFNSPSRSASGNVQLEIPIYQGGAVKSAVRAADKRVASGQAQLRGTESSVFNQVVAAYMDVIRDEAIVELNTKNVNVLDVNLQATKDRFEVGDLTRTDIAQSEARLSEARSRLETAQSNLVESRERYIRLVGDAPVALEPPPPLPNLPATPDAAVAVALTDNPDILAAAREREAARFDVNAARSQRSFRVSAVSGGNYQNFLGTLQSGVEGVTVAQESSSATAGLQATFPLYQGGAPSARVRQAQARETQALEQEIETERGVIAQTRAAYASWQASLDVITSSQAAVDANRLSLEGVRAENSVGNRTILDILNAEQELLNSEVNLVSARRNAYVAGFTLLAAMGQAEARDLGLDGGALYDPAVNYKRVRGRFWDWDEDPDPVARSTRTVDIPAQTPETASVNQ